LSPSTAAIDRADKVPIYAQSGVGHVWLADPVLKTLEVLRLVDGGYRLLATWRGDEKVRAEPFDAVELDLSALWSK
jgi:Uma2 family endonuclease